MIPQAESTHLSLAADLTREVSFGTDDETMEDIEADLQPIETDSSQLHVPLPELNDESNVNMGTYDTAVAEAEEFTMVPNGTERGKDLLVERPKYSYTVRHTMSSKPTPIVLLDANSETTYKPVLDKTWEFHGLDAGKVCHFCKESLKDIAETITREPNDGPPKELVIKCRSKKLQEVEPKVRSIEESIQSLKSSTVSLDPECDRTVLQEKITELTSSKLLCYLDEEGQTIHIVGESLHDISNLARRLEAILKDAGKSKHQSVRSSSPPALPQRTYRSQGMGARSRSPDVSPSRSQSPRPRRHPSDPSSKHSGSPRSSSSKFSFQVMLGNQFSFKIYEASITRLKVDAIVNAANDCLAHGGGVARVIADAAGYELNRESQKYNQRYGNLKVSENCVTTAGDLKYDGVIHAVGPQWLDYRNKEHCLDDLYRCIWNIFETCKKKGYRTVGMPAISAGIYGVPKELCANMYVKAAADFADKLQGSRFPKELHIVDVDVQILKLVRDSYQKWQNDENSISVENSITDYYKDNPWANSSGPSSRQGSKANLRANRRFASGQSEVKGSTGQIKLKDLASQVTAQGSENVEWENTEAQKFRVGQRLIVKIYQGGIQKVKDLDALACGIDKTFTRTGFIVNALKKTGGRAYEEGYDQLSRDRYKLRSNDIKKTVGGKLGVFSVLHLVTERIMFAGEKEIRTYKEGIMNILKAADDSDLEKVAIPLIGAGSIENDQKKLQVCCVAFLNAVCEHCASHTSTKVKELHLVNNKDTVYNMLKDVFTEASQRSKGTASVDTNERPRLPLPSEPMGDFNDTAGAAGNGGEPTYDDVHMGCKDGDENDYESIEPESLSQQESTNSDDSSHYATSSDPEKPEGQPKGNLTIIFE